MSRSTRAARTFASSPRTVAACAFTTWTAMAVAVLLIVGCRPESRTKPEAGAASRVIVLGLDGMDPEVVDLLIGEGKLPHFAELRNAGASAPLAADPPLLSPLIWTSVATGRSASDHGIGAFTALDSTGAEIPITSDLRRVPAVWNIASSAGKRIDVVGWWATWPAEAVDGVVVSDRVGYHFLQEGPERRAGAPSATPAGLVSPPTEASSVLALVRGPETIGPREAAPFASVEAGEFERPFSFSEELSHLRWAIATAHSYRDIGLDLWRRDRPDFLLVYVEATDSIAHLFGHLFRRHDLAGDLARQQRRFGGAVEAAYLLADEIVGTFMNAMDASSTLVVLSDHGFELGQLPTDPGKLQDMRRVSERFHREPGILYLYGRGVRPGARLDGPRILDIAPTLLALGGLPADLEMPGRVLEEGLTGPTVPDRIPSWGARIGRGRPSETLSAAGDAANRAGDQGMLEQLAALGYLGGARTAKNDRNLAFLLLQERRYAEAAAAFKALLAEPSTRRGAAPPPDAALLNGYASALAGMGEEALALRTFTAALAADPIASQTLFNRGLLFERLGRREEAVEDYRAALRYDAEFAPARQALSRLGVAPAPVARTEAEERAAERLRAATDARKRGDYPAAERLLREAETLAPTASVYQELANVAYLRGDRPAAIAALERALELEPDNALLRHNLDRLRNPASPPRVP